MPQVLMPEGCCCGRRKQDLGRFELFRWIFNEPPFGLLLDHVDSTVTSSLQVRCVHVIDYPVCQTCHALHQRCRGTRGNSAGVAGGAGAGGIHCRILEASLPLWLVQLSDTRWAQRVAVTGAGGGRAVFEFTMSQRCGRIVCREPSLACCSRCLKPPALSQLASYDAHRAKHSAPLLTSRGTLTTGVPPQVWRPQGRHLVLRQPHV